MYYLRYQRSKNFYPTVRELEADTLTDAMAAAQQFAEEHCDIGGFVQLYYQDPTVNQVDAFETFWK